MTSAQAATVSAYRGASSVSWVRVAWGGRSDEIEFARIGANDPQAPLLVFLHEGLGSLSMWKLFPDELCRALACRGLSFSRCGYGASSPRRADERWTPEFMHRQAREFLPALFEALDIDAARERPWFFGHSDGGSIALIYAASHPDHTGGLIVEAPHLFVEELSVRSIARTREAYLHGNLRERIARYHRDPDSAFFGWNDVWLDPAFRDWNIEALLPSIRCPVLAIQGLDDEYGTLAQIEGIARAVPGAELLKLPGCGHAPHRDQREALIVAARRFMAQARAEHPSRA